jgi:putative redox protein
MSTTKISMQFGNKFSGTFNGEKTTVNIGVKDGEAMPYELLLGALGACYYATFYEIAKKMRLEYEKVELQIEGIKREEEPAYLIDTKIVMSVFNGGDKDKLARASELAQKYCSIYYTISQVSKMDVELKFL